MLVPALQQRRSLPRTKEEGGERSVSSMRAGAHAYAWANYPFIQSTVGSPGMEHPVTFVLVQAIHFFLGPTLTLSVLVSGCRPVTPRNGSPALPSSRTHLLFPTRLCIGSRVGGVHPQELNKLFDIHSF